MENTSPNNQRINWCWTLNNPTPDEVTSIRALTLTNVATYLVYGEEIGDNLTPHLQGYVELVKKQRLGTVKKIMGFSRVHLEPRFGSQQDAIAYCKKGEQSHSEWTAKKEKGPNYGKNAKVTEMGTKKVQSGGSLTEKQNLIQHRLIQIRSDIMSGKSEQQIYESEPLMAAQYPRYISKIISWVQPEIRKDLKVELHVGPTGCGKTHYAYETYPGIYAMPVKCGQSLWFNGYNGEDTVLFDEFKGEFSLVQFLRVIDIFPIQVETKGGFVWFNPHRIIITSNYNEDEWYDYTNREQSRLALKRRITERYQWQYRKKTSCGSDWFPLIFQNAGPAVPKVVTMVISLDSDSEEERNHDPEEDLPDNWQDLIDDVYEEMEKNTVKIISQSGQQK